MPVRLIPKIAFKEIDQKAKVHPDIASQFQNIYQMLSQIVGSINKSEKLLTSGQIIKDIAFTSGNIVVPHTLGREWIGYFVTKKNNSHFPYNTSTLVHDKKSGIELTAPGAVTFDLYIF